MTSPHRPPPRHRLRVLVMTVLAAAAVGGIVYTFSAPTQRTGPVRPAAVELVSPEGGDLDLRQVTIAADLAAGYNGYLEIDGVEVPDDDLQRVTALNQVILKPQPDSPYKELSPGRHCATIVYGRIGTPRDQSSTYRWCFTLH